ncbi:MAG: redoxin domain-containing protein [Verrucomicrobiota bacterium]
MNSNPPHVPGRTKALLLLLAGTILLAATLGPLIRRELLARLLLRAQAPSETVVAELIEAYPDPVPFLIRLWQTGKLAHRQLAMEGLRSRPPRDGALDRRVETILAAGTTDPDASVREMALSALFDQHSPLWTLGARAQLTSPDPEIRLLGVNYLSRAQPSQAVPALMPMLDDADLRIVTTAEGLLRRWSGIDYGVRVAQAISKNDGQGGLSTNAADLEVIQRGIAQRKAWWQQHQTEYPSSLQEHTLGAAASVLSPAADFVLPDLRGRPVRLSDWRGKVVILNFWTTWCAACLTETPTLAEVQRRNADRLVVLGISLDGVPDQHGHGDVDEEDARTKQSDNRRQAAGRREEQIRSKVERVVHRQAMTYRVLLDPNNVVGSRFKGGELPTSVLIDPQGNVRRRFVGTRTLSAWESMIAELLPRATAASQP